ncbi:MAG: CopG family ribbon-helix-helix protein [Rectinemataceae bacterium]
MSTVNISFTADLLEEIDKVAEEESRSRSELIREAARSYIERKRRWMGIFEVGGRAAATAGLSVSDIDREIRAYRAGKR